MKALSLAEVLILSLTLVSLNCEKSSDVDGPAEWTCSEAISYEGKRYSTVQIGSQCWFKENLDVGTMVQGSDTQKNNGFIEKYCYDNDSINCDLYGGLYQWNEAMQYTYIQRSRGICPRDWHIPTLAEFETLTTWAGGAGNALKAAGQGFGDGAGTNSSGFSALLAGYRREGGDVFYTRGYFAFFWSSTEFALLDPYYLRLVADDNSVSFDDNFITYGHSVRCLRD